MKKSLKGNEEKGKRKKENGVRVRVRERECVWNRMGRERAREGRDKKRTVRNVCVCEREREKKRRVRKVKRRD